MQSKYKIRLLRANLLAAAVALALWTPATPRCCPSAVAFGQLAIYYRTTARFQPSPLSGVAVASRLRWAFDVLNCGRPREARYFNLGLGGNADVATNQLGGRL